MNEGIIGDIGRGLGRVWMVGEYGEYGGFREVWRVRVCRCTS